MMKPTIVILAAGMASRYGSMKQTEGFGPAGETIMDYSIYDAINAGFGKVVLIIREQFAESFEAGFVKKFAGKVEVELVFQELNYFVDPAHIPEGRTKPWGTGHAMLCAAGAVNDPFIVINADDYYGPDAFIKAYDFLTRDCDEKTYAIVGYKLGNTLSDNGTVSRGVCDVDEHFNLVSITERTKIFKEGSGIVYEDEDGKHDVASDSPVSMNFWCFHPTVFDIIRHLFAEFPKNNIENLKGEFFIPYVADYFVKEAGGKIKVIPTSAQWFGVTYKEDAPGVKEKVNSLVADGTYPADLWA